MCVRVAVTLADGRQFVNEETGWEGFNARQMTWEWTAEKFDLLAGKNADAAQRDRVKQVVRNLETVTLKDFAAPLSLARA